VLLYPRQTSISNIQGRFPFFCTVRRGLRKCVLVLYGMHGRVGKVFHSVRSVDITSVVNESPILSMNYSGIRTFRISAIYALRTARRCSPTQNPEGLDSQAVSWILPSWAVQPAGFASVASAAHTIRPSLEPIRPDLQ